MAVPGMRFNKTNRANKKGMRQGHPGTQCDTPFIQTRLQLPKILPLGSEEVSKRHGPQTMLILANPEKPKGGSKFPTFRAEWVPNLW